MSRCGLYLAVTLVCLALVAPTTVTAYPRFAQLATSMTHQQQPKFPVVPGAAPISTLPGPVRPGIVAITPQPQLNPSPSELRAMVDKKVICPFLGAATNAKLFPVFGSLDSPYTLATSMRDIGNTGPGSDFGELVYTLSLVNTPPTTEKGPNLGLGYSTLNLAGSLETHFGFSYILSGPSNVENTGKYDPVNWARFERRFVDGYITTEAFAHWVAENLLLDPLSTPWNILAIVEHTKDALKNGLPVLLHGAEQFLQKAASNVASGSLQPLGPVLLTETSVKPLREAVQAALASNLLNAASQMAFIQTLFLHSPKTRQANGKVPMGISLEDMKTMWIQRELPAGFLTWPKKLTNFAAFLGPMALTAAEALVKAKTIGGIRSVADAQKNIGKI